MTDCEKMCGCEFFKIYGSDQSRKLALAGFVRTYCKGESQNNCLRKIVCKELGGAQHVPQNLMPTGSPLSGTNSVSWSEDVKIVIKKHQQNI